MNQENVKPTLLDYATTQIVLRRILPNIVFVVTTIIASCIFNLRCLILFRNFPITVHPPSRSIDTRISGNDGNCIISSIDFSIIQKQTIAILVLLLNLHGNGIRDALNVKTNCA